MEIIWKNIKNSLVWKDVEDTIDGCVTICKKGNLTIFKILKSKDHFYASYYNDRMFTSPRLTYCNASKMAKDKFNNDSLNNRLIIAKEFFLQDYQNQVSRIMDELKRRSV